MRRLIIKIGSSVIAPDGRLDVFRVRSLVDQLDLTQDEHVIVSSGAIACGASVFGNPSVPSQVIPMQAAAAVGQSQVMHTYERLFFGKKIVAQLLLSSDDFNSSIRYRHLCNTLNELLRLKVLPIVNENDSVSVRELEGAFGDNDELSALLARAINADWLILLTDVDGFYRGNGHPGQAKLVRRISKITPSLEAECNGKGSLGRGGMRSKLRAVRIATACGTHVAIANGSHPSVIPLVLRHRAGTYFPPSGRKKTFRENRIVESAPFSGQTRTLELTSTKDQILG
jgi:glutamate 5-kinase